MKEVKEVLTAFMIGIAIYAAMIECVGIFFSEDILAYSLGLLIGIFIAIALFCHMAKTLDKALDMYEIQAKKYVKKKCLLRLLMMLIGMMIGLAIEQIYFVSLVLGILGCKVGALFAPFFLKKLYPDRYVTNLNEQTDLE